MCQRRVHDRLVSNLKHILVGLEMKAALVVPHAKRGNGKSLLYEPLLSDHEFRVLRWYVFDMRGAWLGTLVGG